MLQMPVPFVGLWQQPPRTKFGQLKARFPESECAAQDHRLAVWQAADEREDEAWLHSMVPSFARLRSFPALALSAVMLLGMVAYLRGGDHRFRHRDDGQITRWP
jgi:hypothetical protein